MGTRALDRVLAHSHYYKPGVGRAGYIRINANRCFSPSYLLRFFASYFPFLSLLLLFCALFLYTPKSLYNIDLTYFADLTYLSEIRDNELK